MPRGKKKATIADGPPADPPQAKKRKASSASSTAAAAEVKVSSDAASTKRTSARTSRTMAYISLFLGVTRRTGRPSKNKDLNVWDQERCEEWFDGYSSEDQNVIDPTGYQQLLEDLSVDITGAMPFIISWKLGTKKTFHITRDEWIHGMKALKVDTLNKMKAALPSLEKYADPSCAEETFLEIYHWTFTYLKENEMCKVVDIDVAIPVLQVLFANRENRHIEPFLDFLKEGKEKGQIKCLNKDQWDVFYEFSRSMDDVFTGYDDTAAWPSLFDEYVEWRQSKKRREGE